jgi:hypothetical protein
MPFYCPLGQSVGEDGNRLVRFASAASDENAIGDVPASRNRPPPGVVDCCFVVPLRGDAAGNHVEFVGGEKRQSANAHGVTVRERVRQVVVAFRACSPSSARTTRNERACRCNPAFILPGWEKPATHC